MNDIYIVWTTISTISKSNKSSRFDIEYLNSLL